MYLSKPTSSGAVVILTQTVTEMCLHGTRDANSGERWQNRAGMT